MRRLYIDLEICAKCEDCTVECPQLLHPDNNVIVPLREYVNFLLVCRRCKDAPCVNSCSFEAIEKQADEVLKRYSLRCVSCKSCSWACPFGTIYPETIPYLSNKCEMWLSRLDEKSVDKCVLSCPHGAVMIEETEPDPAKDLHLVTDRLIVRSIHWSGNSEAKKP